jgi:D-alanyl-D-alanine carboxypeptidase
VHDGEYRDGRVARRRWQNIAGAAVGGLAALLLLSPTAAEAAHHARRHARHHVRHALVASGVASEAIVIDADNGRVLSQSNADEPTYAASLTKMMTLYLTFEALDTGRLKLDQLLPVSALAASQPPTKLGLRPGERVSVHDLILGMITRSANDAAVVMAEGLGGSEAGFAQLMTEKARQLGMANTIFVNPNGLPEPGQHTTARDMARLALALYRDFPNEYHYFATREFDFAGRTIRTHNHLLDSYPGADGIKTGYIRASGYNLAASAVRDGHRVIAVVMGGPSVSSRDHEMAALLDQAFAEIGGGATTVARNEPSPAPKAVPRPAPEVVAAVDRSERHDRAALDHASRRGPRVVTAVARGEHHDGAALDRLTARIAAQLSPVGRAEAAPFRHVDRTAPLGERWAVQLGAFRRAGEAEEVARRAAALHALRGKPLQIVGPHQAGHDHLYRARLLNFSHREAKSACAALHRKKIACTVVPASRVAYASGR